MKMVTWKGVRFSKKKVTVKLSIGLTKCWLDYTSYPLLGKGASGSNGESSGDSSLDIIFADSVVTFGVLTITYNVDKYDS